MSNDQRERKDAEVSDINEMRRRLTHAGYAADYRLRPGFSALSAIIRSCHQTADVVGFSGEDRFVLMAWQLLQAARRYEDIVMREAALAPPAPMVMAWPWIAVADRMPEPGAICDWLFPRDAIKCEQWILCAESAVTASVPGSATHWRPAQAVPHGVNPSTKEQP
jgi:hypothetical protein